jgi:hypothetical protein
MITAVPPEVFVIGKVQSLVSGYNRRAEQFLRLPYIYLTIEVRAGTKVSFFANTFRPHGV